jgi:pyruvate,water dikinase
VLSVAKLAKDLEKQKKCPQDVEWAIDADAPEGANLFALQSRPETVWSQKAKEAAKPKTYGTGMMGLVSALSTPIPKT